MLSASPFGNSACIGAYNPNKLNQTTSLDVKLLHEHFYEKLNSAYTDIYDYLDLTVSHLSDTVHSISADTFVPPIPYQGEEDTVLSIMALLPTYLENHQNRIPIYPNFERFFSQSLAKCPDFVLRYF